MIGPAAAGPAHTRGPIDREQLVARGAYGAVDPGHLAESREPVGFVQLARVEEHVRRLLWRLQHLDLEGAHGFGQVLLRVRHDLVLVDRDRPQSARIAGRVVPLAVGGAHQVQPREIPARPAVGAVDRVGHYHAAGLVDGADQLHVRVEADGGPRGFAAAEGDLGVEALLELGPVPEDAAFDVDRAVDAGQRRQEDAERDHSRHHQHAGLPKVPAGVAREADVTPADVLHGFCEMAPEQQAQGQDQEGEHVAVLVGGEVEQRRREGGRARDQTQQRLPPAQHAPGQPAADQPEEQRQQEQEEGDIRAGRAVGQAPPPGAEQTDGFGGVVRVRRAERRGGGDVGGDRRGAEAHEQADRPRHKSGQGQQPDHDRGHDRNPDDHVRPGDPGGLNRRARDRQCQQQHAGRRDRRVPARLQSGQPRPQVRQAAS